MTLLHLWQGIIIGFSIAAPVGPVGVLCIRRTLVYGRVSGLFSGLGAATADALYGCVAAFGLTAISGPLLQQQHRLELAGGVFLCYLGVKTFLAAPSARPVGENRGGSSLAAAYGSTFLLTLTNPATILSFAAVFTGLGLLNSGRTPNAAVALVAGVFSGSALWWLVLSGGVSIFREQCTARRLRWVNRASGVVIGGFGLLVLAYPG